MSDSSRPAVMVIEHVLAPDVVDRMPADSAAAA